MHLKLDETTWNRPVMVANEICIVYCHILEIKSSQFYYTNYCAKVLSKLNAVPNGGW